MIVIAVVGRVGARDSRSQSEESSNAVLFYEVVLDWPWSVATTKQENNKFELEAEKTVSELLAATCHGGCGPAGVGPPRRDASVSRHVLMQTCLWLTPCAPRPPGCFGLWISRRTASWDRIGSYNTNIKTYRECMVIILHCIRTKTAWSNSIIIEDLQT